jgi:hypothetical protein
MLRMNEWIRARKNHKGILISVGRRGRKAEEKWDDFIHRKTRIRIISEENSL